MKYVLSVLLTTIFACNNLHSINRIKSLGTIFPDLETKAHHGYVGNNGPDWRTITTGLNIAIECPEDGYPSRKEYSWIPIGIKEKTYSVNKLVTKDLKCSACKKDIEAEYIVGVGFYNCKYEMNGIKLKNKFLDPKKSNQEKYKVPSEWTIDGKIAKLFSKDWTYWIWLDIIVNYK